MYPKQTTNGSCHQQSDQDPYTNQQQIAPQMKDEQLNGKGIKYIIDPLPHQLLFACLPE